MSPITATQFGQATGTVIQVAGSLEQGRAAESIAEERELVDLQNAEAVREASVEQAQIKAERGRRILATQKSQAAAGGVRIDQGFPLLAEAETRAAIVKDIGLGLKRGRVQALGLRGSARLERAAGKVAKRRSTFDAISRGVKGFGSIAFMGTQKKLPVQGTFKAETGMTQSEFGQAFISS